MMGGLSRVVVACMLAVCLACLVDGKVSSGHLKGFQFVYMDKFCYGTGVGSWEYTIKANSKIPNLQMLFFDDEGGNWSHVYHHTMSCKEVMEWAGFWPEQVTIGEPSTITLHQTQRPHFWFTALFACNETIDIDFSTTMLQESNSKWAKQFSWDEQGLEGLYLFFFVLFVVAGAVHGYTIWVFVRTSSYHSLVRLFTLSIALEGVSVFCLFLHYEIYSTNGIGNLGLKGIGELLDIAAQIVFMLMVILIAKGWSISKHTLDHRLPIIIGMGALVVAYLAMFIWENVGLDPAETLYVYQTTPGIIILVVRSLAMVFFIYCTIRTYIDEYAPAKRTFYLYFGVVYTLWFISLPLITGIAAALDPWVRQKIVMCIYVTCNAIFLFVFGFLLWPTRASEYFQISARELGSMPYDAI